MFQALHYDIARSISNKFIIHTCVMTYEGRPWERYFIAGLKNVNIKTNIIGYQHTVVRLAAADMFLHKNEKKNIPLPDKIITTGEIPKQILQKNSSYPKNKVINGCALRFESLQNKDLISRRNRDINKSVLLIAFGGSLEELPLFKYVLNQSNLNKNIIFRLRLHPSLNFKKLSSFL